MTDILLDLFVTEQWPLIATETEHRLVHGLVFK